MWQVYAYIQLTTPLLGFSPKPLFCLACSHGNLNQSKAQTICMLTNPSLHPIHTSWNS